MKKLLGIKVVVFLGAFFLLFQSVFAGAGANETVDEVAVVSNMVMTYPAIKKEKSGSVCNYVIPGFPLARLEANTNGISFPLEKVVFCDVNDDKKVNDGDCLVIVTANQGNIFRIFQVNPPLVFVNRGGIFNRGFFFSSGVILLGDLKKDKVLNEKEVKELEDFFDYICVVAKMSMLKEMVLLLGVMEGMENERDSKSPQIFRNQ
jgi:hypothetical protein